MGKAPRLLGQGIQDCRWPDQGKLDQEQERQDREQESKRPRQEEPLDQGLRSCTRGSQNQRICRDQEGNSALQEGKGALQEVSPSRLGRLPLGKQPSDLAGFRGKSMDPAL